MHEIEKIENILLLPERSEIDTEEILLVFTLFPNKLHLLLLSGSADGDSWTKFLKLKIIKFIKIIRVPLRSNQYEIIKKYLVLKGILFQGMF